MDSVPALLILPLPLPLPGIGYLSA